MLELFRSPKEYTVYLIYITGSFMKDTLNREVDVNTIHARSKKEAESLSLMELKNKKGDVTVELIKCEKA